jgi:hypothetical protein
MVMGSKRTNNNHQISKSRADRTQRRAEIRGALKAGRQAAEKARRDAKHEEKKKKG